MTLDELVEAARSLEREGRDLIARASSSDELAAARTALVGRKSGRLTELMKTLPALPPDARREAGAAVNRAKEALETTLDAREAELRSSAPAEPRLDLTMPARRSWRGAVHPVTLVIDEIREIFRELGFTVAVGPEAETDWYNFGALNFPADHPAMDMHDTLYLGDGVNDSLADARATANLVNHRHRTRLRINRDPGVNARGLRTAVIALLAIPTLSLHLGTSDQGNNPSSATTRQAYDLLADGFGPGVNGPLTLVTEVNGAADRLAIDNLGSTLTSTPGVASVSPVTYDDGGSAAFLTVVPDSAPQSKATSDLVDRLRTDVLPKAETDTSLDVHVGGVTAGYDDFAEIIVGKLPLFVGVVIGLGCVLLLLAFRSVGIPLKAAVMNVAAVAAAFGVVVAVFQWGWGSELMGLGRAGPIEPFLPVIMVSVLFGLSMDYQVFLVSRMYEEWLETGDNRVAVRVGLAETSRVINSAAVIMISVFLAFVLSGDRVIAMFGIALAAAVALDAFVLRTLLVPALMHMLGGANWWLPKRLDRWLPRISIEVPESRVRATIPGQCATEDAPLTLDDVTAERHGGAR